MAKPFSKLVALLTPKRRWAQFSLLTLFLVVTVLCVGLRLVVVPAEKQRRAVAAIKALGGRVDYVKPSEEASEAFPRPFLRRWLPQDYFDEVRKVDFRFDQGNQVTDAGLAHLLGLSALQELNLNGSTHVTDAGMAHLQGLTRLQMLLLGGTQVTDAGLAHLHEMTELHVLDLFGIQVNDAGLAHLHGLTGLQTLFLSGTQVTDARLAQLRQALPNCKIVGP